LNIQKISIIVPGIDITLDLGFQFALLISAMLGYIYFLQKYWERNAENSKLSNSFTDFAFWDLPRLKRPLLLIPIVIAFAIFIQVSIKSSWLLMIFLSIIMLVGIFVFKRFQYFLSPDRNYEMLVENWRDDNEWLERWSRRIRKQLSMYIGVRERDLYEAGKSKNKINKIEIVVALHQYFEKYEFDEDLILMRRGEFHYQPPYYSSVYNDEWALLARKNLELRDNE
jgi:hypothetical protein